MNNCVMAILAAIAPAAAAGAVSEKSHLLYDLVAGGLALVIALLVAVVLQRLESVWQGALDLIDRARRPRSLRNGHRGKHQKRKDGR